MPSKRRAVLGGRQYGVKPRIEYEISGISSSKGMVEQGIAVAIFGYAGLKEEIDSGRPRAIPFSSPLLNRKLCIAYPRRDDARSAILNVKAIIEHELDRLLQEGFWQGARRIHELQLMRARECVCAKAWRIRGPESYVDTSGAALDPGVRAVCANPMGMERGHRESRLLLSCIE